MKHNREELIQRLKEIAAEEIPMESRTKGWNAMCYRMAAPEDLYTKCDYCKHPIIYSSWGRNRIHEIVNEMLGLGYDVKVAVLCDNCYNKLKAELYDWDVDKIDLDEEHSIEIECSNRNFVFYFRGSTDESYHCALSSNEEHYKSVLAFFKGENSYYGYRTRKKYLVDEIAIIEYMTGLKIDE